MAPKIPAAKITDLVTTVESGTVQTSGGPMVWGAVDILYASEGLEPRVTIRVAVPAFETQSDEQRRADVLRRARRLIDHACVAMGPVPESTPGIAETLEGLAEELGVLAPTTHPRRARGM